MVYFNINGVDYSYYLDGAVVARMITRELKYSPGKALKKCKEYADYVRKLEGDKWIMI